MSKTGDHDDNSSLSYTLPDIPLKHLLDVITPYGESLPQPDQKTIRFLRPSLSTKLSPHHKDESNTTKEDGNDEDQGKPDNSINQISIPHTPNGCQKGGHGRLLIIGGSRMFSGAPAFVGLSALELGVDMVQIYCEPTALTSIRSFNPNIMAVGVLPSMEDYYDKLSTVGNLKGPLYDSLGYKFSEYSYPVYITNCMPWISDYIHYEDAIQWYHSIQSFIDSSHATSSDLRDVLMRTSVNDIPQRLPQLCHYLNMSIYNLAMQLNLLCRMSDIYPPTGSTHNVQEANTNYINRILPHITMSPPLMFSIGSGFGRDPFSLLILTTVLGIIGQCSIDPFNLYARLMILRPIILDAEALLTIPFLVSSFTSRTKLTASTYDEFKQGIDDHNNRQRNQTRDKQVGNDSNNNQDKKKTDDNDTTTNSAMTRYRGYKNVYLTPNSRELSALYKALEKDYKEQLEATSCGPPSSSSSSTIPSNKSPDNTSSSQTTCDITSVVSPGTSWILPGIAKFIHLGYELEPDDDSSRKAVRIARLLGNVTILIKGEVDVITDGVIIVYNSFNTGCPRRCGGLGDINAGVLATFALWSQEHYYKSKYNIFGQQYAELHHILTPAVYAAVFSSMVVKHASSLAFHQKHYAMSATDVIHCLPSILSHTLSPDNTPNNDHT